MTEEVKFNNKVMVDSRAPKSLVGEKWLDNYLQTKELKKRRFKNKKM